MRDGFTSLLDKKHGASLHELELWSLGGVILNLKESVSLTSLKLDHVIPKQGIDAAFSLSLPASLQKLRVVGDGLTKPVN